MYFLKKSPIDVGKTQDLSCPYIIERKSRSPQMGNFWFSFRGWVTRLSTSFEEDLCYIFNRQKWHFSEWQIKLSGVKIGSLHVAISLFSEVGWVWIIHTDSWRQLYNIGLRPVIRFRGISPLYAPNNITFHIRYILHYTHHPSTTHRERSLEIYSLSSGQKLFSIKKITFIMKFFFKFFSRKSPCV